MLTSGRGLILSRKLLIRRENLFLMTCLLKCLASGFFQKSYEVMKDSRIETQLEVIKHFPCLFDQDDCVSIGCIVFERVLLSTLKRLK